MNLRAYGIAGVVLAALVAAACSGGSRALPPTGSPDRAHSVTARIVVVIPKHAKHRRRRHDFDPQYVSASTQSVQFTLTTVNGGSIPSGYTTSVTVSLGTGCTNNSGTYTCSTSWKVPAATDAFTVVAYDGTNATGTALSRNTVTQAVSTGNSTIGVTLDGIPTSVVIVPTDSTKMSGSTGAGFTVSKCLSSTTVHVYGVDADGNQIIGSGTPSPGLSSDNTTYLSVATPGPTASPIFTLSRPNIPPASQVVHLTGSVTPLSGSGGSSQNVQASVTFNTDICGVITEFSSGISSSAGMGGIAAGADGNLWFTEGTGNRIGRITTAGVVTEFSSGISSGAYPSRITSGPDNNLWFTEQNGNRIAKMTTAGVVTEFSSGITSGGTPSGITSGPDGNLWFTEVTGRVAKATTSGTVTEYSSSIIGSSPNLLKIVVGPDNNLWFAQRNYARIGTVTTAGVIGQYSSGISSFTLSITSGPDGNLWFTEGCVNKVARITTSGTVTEYSSGITSSSTPQDITKGPDGNLWFTEINGNRIGKLTTAGVVTEYSSGLISGSHPYNLTLGPDNNLWFTETSGNRIGRVQ